MTLNKNFFVYLHQSLCSGGFTGYGETENSQNCIAINGTPVKLYLTDNPLYPSDTIKSFGSQSSFNFSTTTFSSMANGESSYMFVLPVKDAAPIDYNTVTHAANTYDYIHSGQTIPTEEGFDPVVIQTGAIKYKNSGISIITSVTNPSSSTTNKTIGGMILVSSNCYGYSDTDTPNKLTKIKKDFIMPTYTYRDKDVPLVLCGKIVLPQPVTLQPNQTVTLKYNLKGLQFGCQKANPTLYLTDASINE